MNFSNAKNHLIYYKGFNVSNLIEGFLGQSVDGKKSLAPAKMDFIQSATGLFLALFMWGHMFFVASILLGNDAMYTITKMFEGSFIFGDENSQPLIVSVIVFIVFAIFIIHACLAMRKFPANYRQWQVYRTHMHMMKHGDTTYWFWQATTGIVMFFLGSAHLYMMMTMSDTIGPFGSGDRMWSNFMWPFYLILLIAVEVHGTVGLYRLSVKWGWFDGKDYKQTRARLKKVKWAITVFFLALGLMTLLTYVKIGFDHKDNAGQRYTPSTAQIHLQTLEKRV